MPHFGCLNRYSDYGRIAYERGLQPTETKVNTDETPSATTSCKRPPPISDRQSKTPKFSQSKALKLEPLVNDHRL